MPRPPDDPKTPKPEPNRRSKAEPLRFSPLGGRGASRDRVVVEVRSNHYAPKDIAIRSWLSPTRFIALITPKDRKRLSADAQVISISEA